MCPMSPSANGSSGPIVVRSALASGEIARGVSGRVANAAAYGPCCVDLVQDFISSQFDLSRVELAAKELRLRALGRARESGLGSNHLSWLSDHGFSREDTRRISFLVEVFYDVEPVVAIITALVIRFDSDISREPVTLPPHRFYRELSAWPEYARFVRDEIMISNTFTNLVKSTLYDIEALASEIPSSDDEAIDSDSDGILSPCAEAFLTESANVISLTSILRPGLISDEESGNNHWNRR